MSTASRNEDGPELVAGAKPFVDVLAPDQPTRRWWAKVDHNLRERLSLTIRCSSDMRAARVAIRLYKKRRASGQKYVITQRGTTVYVIFPVGGPRATST